MERRPLLETLGGVVAVGLAGCSGEPTTDTATTTKTTCSLPTTESVTTPRQTPTKHGTCCLSGGLSIRSGYPKPLTVILTLQPDGKTTFARQYPSDVEFIDLGGEMRDTSDYDVVIRSGCDVLWERTIDDAETLEISIKPDGSVEILEQAMA